MNAGRNIRPLSSTLTTSTLFELVSSQIETEDTLSKLSSCFDCMKIFTCYDRFATHILHPNNFYISYLYIIKWEEN